MRLAATLPCPAYAMIRPNTGDYVVTPDDIDVMRGDIDAALEAGLPGVVLGACRPGGQLDEDVLGRLIEHTDGRGVTLHRVFDAAPDMNRALDTAIALGFDRVLTSGGASGAPDGVEMIAGLVAQAAGRISVMAGAGLHPGNVADVIARTGVHEVHGSCGVPVACLDTARASRLDHVFGAGFTAVRVTDEATVAAMVAILRGLD
jgi:copper homeostasis protein